MSPRPSLPRRTALPLCLALVCVATLRGAVVARWDFREGPQGWRGNALTADLATTADGLCFRSTGPDPWIEGPAVDLASGRITRVVIRMRSNADTNGELFYGPTFRAGDSVRFTVTNDDAWHDVELVINASLGPGTRLRLDPAAGPGRITVQSLAVESLAPAPIPPLVRPAPPEDAPPRRGRLRSGALVVTHGGRSLGDFQVRSGDRLLACGDRHPLLGVTGDTGALWLDLGRARVTVRAAANGGIVVGARLDDPQGAVWTLERSFTPGPRDGSVTVSCRLRCDREQGILRLPWLTLYAGLGSFGTHKDQAVLPGLEYLADEPSSSTTDITTADHRRRAPDPLKVTWPLMALCQGGHGLGLLWEPGPWTNALFDSPDRVTGAAAHLLGVTGPAVGPHRFENDLAAYRPVPLRAGVTLSTTITLLAGPARSVVPILRQAVALRGLPPCPAVPGGWAETWQRCAHGWLDSQLREGSAFRHAVWNEHFRPGPAADVAAYVDWLATDTRVAPDQAERLSVLRDAVLARFGPADPLTASVGHVKQPTSALRFDRVPALIRDAHRRALIQLRGFEPDGRRIYRPGDRDLGRGHFADHANGYGIRAVVQVLQAASLSLDPALVTRALTLLDQQTALYADTVPRGAQTWEIPLHTPDMLASAALVEAYVLGFLLTERPAHLEQARAWAWTGLAFVYLDDPTDQPVGRYATIPVFGATHWVGSWFGRPVQWCGIVYAAALHALSRLDPDGPWADLARGITASGLQQTWPLDDAARQGLLPDFYHLRSQVSDGPAINPGTLQATIPELFDRGTLYDLRRVPGRGWLIHAPCALRELRTTGRAVTFRTGGWGASPSNRPYSILVAGTADAVVSRREGGTWRPVAAVDLTVLRDPGPVTVIRLRGPAELRLRAHQP